MIDEIISVAKMILAILPFVLLCLANIKTNLPKPQRSRQFPMPVITLVYAIVSMSLLNKINQWLIWVIESIPKWISRLGEFSWMPEPIVDIIDYVSDFIDSILQKLNLNFWIFFISNTAIIVVYLILKKICLPIISKIIKSDGKIHTAIAEKFYEFFPERDQWCIREDFVQVRSMLRVFYYAAVVLSAILMLVSRYLYYDDWLKSVFYPVFGIMVVGELYFYLDGLTRREYSSDILGEDEDAYRTVNYSLLRKFLRSIFKDKLLTENTGLNSALSYDLTTDDIIRELEESEDQKILSFAAYIKALNSTGFKIDHNYLNSSLEMLNGKSILFNNPFYNDLIPYAFYPMNRALLSHQKVLVVLGRHAVEDDIKEWVENGIGAVTNIPFMWNVGVLGAESQELDIGIITRSDVLDIKMHEANADFLEKVGFCVILEPSKLISTAQIGLNMIVKKCNGMGSKDIVYCLCDQNCDGLVDAMSHILMTSITEVSATKKHLGTSSYMCWEPDAEYLHHRLVPNISRYLGLGTELSFAALKNQVSKTTWYGGDAFPVVDLRWIAKQYYYDLTKYAGLPTNQEAMDEHFATTSNSWSARVEKHNYITVEDESFNMFEILRDFSTRTTEQGFINVISSEYLLKDYMADNASIFEADPKAIPYIVADHARTNRNVILRCILMMSTYPVKVEVLEKEFSLLGVKVFDLKKQLWFELYNCYADVAEIAALDEDYMEAVESVASRKIKLGKDEVGINIIRTQEKFSLKSGTMENTYFINNPVFLESCVAELCSAGYVAEDEKGEKYYLGAELCGQIYQKYLPGQFFTFGGKYYEMQYLTADGQVLVRRAADHINGRPAYRQIRNYTINGVRPSDKIGSQQNISGLKVIKEFADITVNTPGYYRMERYNDFVTAKKILFEGEKNGIPKRVYHNKEILRIDLPDMGDKLNDNIRYTITMLFNEVFRSLFAENQAFICALTDTSFLTEEDEIRPLTYSLEAESFEIGNNSIYIIEDSQLDLGLTVTVERNLQRIFQIIHDYLDWHMESMEESLVPPPEPKVPVEFSNKPQEPSKKKGFFGKIIDKIKGIFKKKPKKPYPDIVPDPEADPAVDGEVAPEAYTEPDKEIPPAEPAAPEKKGIWARIKGLFGRKKPKEGEGEPGENPDGVPSEPTDGENPENPDGETPENPDGETPENPDGETPVGPDGETPENPQGEPVDNPEGVPVDTEPSGLPQGETPTAPVEPEKPKKKGIFGRIKDWFSGKKGKKGKKKDGEAPEAVPTYPVPTGEVPEFPQVEPISEGGSDIPEMPPVPVDTDTDDTDPVPAFPQGTADGAEGGVSTEPAEFTECPVEDEEIESSEDGQKFGFPDRAPYHDRYYTLFGGENELHFIDLHATLDFLSEMGFGRNPLKQAREGKNIAAMVEATFKPGRPDVRYCDFCGAEIYGVEYETLADGRDRCLNCGRTAIKTGEEFRKIFEDVKRNMESFFGIRINVGVKVEMVNSKTLHKRLGKAFVATPDSDGRVLGVAIKDKNGYTLMVENGSPRMASMLTMAHELTHIWQYVNWKDKEIRKKYGRAMRLEIYEGMAKWVEIQYAYLINEPAIAKREDIITSYRDDEYGHGFLRYKDQYPFSLGTVITKPTPFLNLEEPLDPDRCGNITVKLPPIDGMPGAVTPDDETPNGPKKPGPEPIKGPIERDPTNVRMYAYELLSDGEKSVYNTLLQAITNFVGEVTTFEAYVTNDQVNKIIDYIQRDHPENFWFQHGATFYFDTQTHIVDRVELRYCMSPEEAASRQEQIKQAIGPFLESVDENMSDYEVTLRIYENIIKLVDYDTIGLERQKKLTIDPTKPDDLRSIYGVFVNKKAVCAGYAKATQYLLNMFGIECTYATSETHAWNLIKLEGDYYHLDTTWGDGSDTKAEKNVTDSISYDCFCITTAEVLRLKSHTPESSFPLPECTATKCNYHHRYGLYFRSYDFAKIREIVCDNVQQSKFEISFKFAEANVFETAKKDLVDAHKFRELIQYANLKGSVRVKGGYKYSVSDDKLTIRLKLEQL